MENLIKLLNEYEEKYNKSDLYYKFELENGEIYCYDDVTDYQWTMQDEAMVICSRHYGFIQWLVDNDKIKDEEWRYLGSKDMQSRFSNTNILLMLLAIQDKPIEFLISILK